MFIYIIYNTNLFVSSALSIPLEVLCVYTAVRVPRPVPLYYVCTTVRVTRVLVPGTRVHTSTCTCMNNVCVHLCTTFMFSTTCEFMYVVPVICNCN